MSLRPVPTVPSYHPTTLKMRGAQHNTASTTRRPGSGLKGSLRSMPSAFFARGEKAPDISTLQPRAKSKRKGLASILGRGNVKEADFTPFSTTGRVPPPSSFPVPQNKQRPSCGPDPFGRPAEGARVIHLLGTAVPSQDVTKPRTPSPLCKETPGSESLRGIPVVSIDDVDVDDLDDTDSNGTGKPVSSAKDIANLAYTPEVLPRRVSSLGRNLEGMVTQPLAKGITANRGYTSLQLSPRAEPAPTKTIAKEKTRSRVWGMFTVRRKKDKAAPPVSEPSLPILPRPPTLHVTRPSFDSKESPGLQEHSSATTSSPRPIIDTTSPFITRRSSKLARGNLLEGLLQSSEQPLSLRTPSGTSRKSLPKRKSLAGLFSMSAKKGGARLRSITPSPRMKQAGSPVVDETPSRKGMDLTEGAHALLDDTSPDTRAFYSRQQSQHATGDNTPFNVGDISAANHQLSSFLARLKDTPAQADPASPTPGRKMRPAILGRKRQTSPGGSVFTATDSPSHRLDLRGSRTPGQPTPTPLKDAVKNGVRSLFAVSSPAHGQPTPLGDGLVVQAGPRPCSTSSAAESHFTVDIPAVNTRHLSIPVKGAAPTPPLPLPTSDEESEPPSRSISPIVTRLGSKPPKLSLTPFDRSSKGSIFSDFWTPVLGGFKRHSMGSDTESGASHSSLALPSPRAATDNRNTFDMHLARLDSGGPSDNYLNTLRKTQSRSRWLPSDLEAELRSDGPDGGSATVPFQGQPAFQKHMSSGPKSQPLYPPPPFALPPPPRPAGGRSKHCKQESAISFASMSSLGAPLNSGRENTIDQVFAPPPSSLFTEGNHSRQTSATSVELAELSFVAGSVDMRNKRRPSLLRRHVRTGSTESSYGRPDWRSHNRRESLESATSLTRLGRPGLGDRMFQGRASDTTVNGSTQQSSPAREGDDGAPSSSHAHRYSYASAWSSCEPGSEETCSVFDSDTVPTDFAIKGPRPLSGISTAASSQGVDDTFGSYDDHPSNRAAFEENFIAQYLEDSVPNTHGGRRRPTALYLDDQEIDLPSLISPSTSDASSLFSFETRGSQPPSANLRARFGHGPKTSITSAIHVQPTIREEPSQSTVRAPTPGLPPGSPALAAPAEMWELRAEAHTEAKWRREEKISQDLPRLYQEVERMLIPTGDLPQPQKSHRPAHRRQTSISNSRSSISPYCPPLAPVTRYQNKRGSSSSSASCSEDALAILTAFARDKQPSPLPPVKSASTPPRIETRPRVRSSARRRNLGWSRRRSDQAEADKPTPASEEAHNTFPTFLAFSPHRRVKSKKSQQLKRSSEFTVQVDQNGSPSKIPKARQRTSGLLSQTSRNNLSSQDLVVKPPSRVKSQQSLNFGKPILSDNLMPNKNVNKIVNRTSNDKASARVSSRKPNHINMQQRRAGKENSAIPVYKHGLAL